LTGRGRTSATETLIFHELRVYNHVNAKDRPITYCRTGAGVEVDFVIEIERKTVDRTPRVVLLETKLGKQWKRKWEHGLRELMRSDKVSVAGAYGIYTGDETYSFDGIEVLPAERFLYDLHAGRVF